MTKLQGVIVAVREFSLKLQTDFHSYYQSPIIQVTNDGGNGICQKYNIGLHKLNLDDNSWIIFSHDDVEILTPLEELKRQLAEAENDGFKIAAVAGSTEVPPLYPGFWWHGLTSKEFRGSGAVVHKTPGTQKMRHIESYGPFPQQLASFDGLWFAVKTDVLKIINFEENLDGYHYYDADFCAEARAAGIAMTSIGVLAFHNQWGKGIEDPNFARLQKKFIEKWKPRLAEFKKLEKVKQDSSFVNTTSAF